VASKGRSRLLVPEGVIVYDTHHRILSTGLEVHRRNECEVEFGDMLSQVQEGYESVVAYGSTAPSKAERKYCVT
jgi:hypothetical protein